MTLPETPQRKKEKGRERERETPLSGDWGGFGRFEKDFVQQVFLDRGRRTRQTPPLTLGTCMGHLGFFKGGGHESRGSTVFVPTLRMLAVVGCVCVCVRAQDAHCAGGDSPSPSQRKERNTERQQEKKRERDKGRMRKSKREKERKIKQKNMKERNRERDD